jgi:hypothetical protein
MLLDGRSRDAATTDLHQKRRASHGAKLNFRLHKSNQSNYGIGECRAVAAVFVEQRVFIRHLRQPNADNSLNVSVIQSWGLRQPIKHRKQINLGGPERVYDGCKYGRGGHYHNGPAN